MSLRAAIGAGLLLAAFFAAEPPLRAQGRAEVPTNAAIVNLSMLDSLVAVGASSLVGVFSFIPDEKSPMAMSDYLMHYHKALKRFVMKCESDVKEVRGVNEWDMKVLLFLVGINTQRSFPAGVKRVPKKWMARINNLSLEPHLTLGMMAARRAAKKAGMR